MGLFLSMSGVIGGSGEAVAEALRGYAQDRSGTLEAAPALDPAAGNCLSICTAAGGTTVLYPDGFLHWNEASQALSQRLGKAVFSFHIHDGDLWMYLLYDNGAVVDQFNPVPGYWGPVDEAERSAWTGNAAKVASRAPGLTPEHVVAYLVPWGGPRRHGRECRAHPGACPGLSGAERARGGAAAPAAQGLRDRPLPLRRGLAAHRLHGQAGSAVSRQRPRRAARDVSFCLFG